MSVTPLSVAVIIYTVITLVLLWDGINVLVP